MRVSDFSSTVVSLGTSIEGLFDTYVSHVEKVDGEYWEGVAAEAAFERAHNDRATARTIVDTLERVAGTITTGYHAIKGTSTSRATLSPPHRRTASPSPRTSK